MLIFTIYDGNDKPVSSANEKYETLQSAKIGVVNSLKQSTMTTFNCGNFSVVIFSEETGEMLSKGTITTHKGCVFFDWDDNPNINKRNIDENISYTDINVLKNNLTSAFDTTIQIINELERRGKRIDLHVEQYVRTSYDCTPIPEGQTRTYIRFFVKDGKQNG